MTRPEKQLLELFRSLDDNARRSLVDFAEFLVSRGAAAIAETGPAGVPEPVAIPRPVQESVVKAIKRLSESYHMLDKGKMLNETSSLMAQHIIHGRGAGEVIDELEIVFRTHYERLLGKE